jgi:hypothetical protein
MVLPVALVCLVLVSVQSRNVSAIERAQTFGKAIDAIAPHGQPRWFEDDAGNQSFSRGAYTVECKWGRSFIDETCSRVFLFDAAAPADWPANSLGSISEVVARELAGKYLKAAGYSSSFELKRDVSLGTTGSGFAFTGFATIGGLPVLDSELQVSIGTDGSLAHLHLNFPNPMESKTSPASTKSAIVLSGRYCHSEIRNVDLTPAHPRSRREAGPSRLAANLVCGIQVA